MNTDIDFPQLFKRLTDEQVDFVLIGGFAAVVLGVPFREQGDV